MSNPYITKPKVYVLGRQVVVADELGRFLNDEGVLFSTDTSLAAEVLTEVAGRTCYMSFGKGRKSNREYIENILASKHGSVLEHAVWSLLITGVSRALTHELVRHRAGFGYSQLSQRYVDESHAAFVVPPAILDDPQLESEWLQQVQAAQQAYVDAVEGLMKKYAHVENKVHRRKMAREAARAVL